MTAPRKRKSRKRKTGKTKKEVSVLDTLEGGSDPAVSIERSLEGTKTGNDPKAANGCSPTPKGKQTPNTSNGIGHHPDEINISPPPDGGNDTGSSDIRAHSQVPEEWDFTPDNHQEYGFEAFLASPAHLYDNIYSKSHPSLALIQDYLIFVRSAMRKIFAQRYPDGFNSPEVAASPEREVDEEFLRKALYWYMYREVQLSLRYGIITEEESSDTLTEVYTIRSFDTEEAKTSDWKGKDLMLPDTEEAKTTNRDWEDLMEEYELALEGHRLWLETFKLENLAKYEAVGDGEYDREGCMEEAALD